MTKKRSARKQTSRTQTSDDTFLVEVELNTEDR